MPVYSCPKCDYETDRKNLMDDHITTGKCKKGHLHGNVKQKKFPACIECGEKFTTPKLLDKHILQNHTEINIKKSRNNNNNIINGKVTKLINTTTMNTNNNSNNHNTNITNHIHIHNPIIYNYQKFEINDMTIFEQYLAFTTSSSPYKGILSTLTFNPNKPEYHNMKITNKYNTLMDVHDGTEWISEFKKNALVNIINSENDILKKLYFRFRIFLKKDYLKKCVTDHYDFCALKKKKEVINPYQKIQESINIHIYNKTKSANNKNFVVPDSNDPIWLPLNKNFLWNDVESVLTKIDELNINMNTSRINIKESILNEIKKNPKLKQLFKKFLKQIDKIQKNNGNNRGDSASTFTATEETSSSSSSSEEETKCPISKKKSFPKSNNISSSSSEETKKSIPKKYSKSTLDSSTECSSEETKCPTPKKKSFSKSGNHSSPKKSQINNSTKKSSLTKRTSTSKSHSENSDS